VLYRGEINDSQEAAWRKTVEVFDERKKQTEPFSLFPADRPIPLDEVNAVSVVLPVPGSHPAAQRRSLPIPDREVEDALRFAVRRTPL